MKHARSMPRCEIHIRHDSPQALAPILGFEPPLPVACIRASVCGPCASQPQQADCFTIMLQSASQHNPCSANATSLSGGGAELIGRVAAVLGADKGQDLPKIVRVLDD